jgi:hypothetical protein
MSTTNDKDLLGVLLCRIADLPVGMLTNAEALQALDALVRDYLKADADGHDWIVQTAAREAAGAATLH